MLIRDWGIGVICIKNHSGGSYIHFIWKFYIEMYCVRVCV